MIDNICDFIDLLDAHNRLPDDKTKLTNDNIMLNQDARGGTVDNRHTAFVNTNKPGISTSCTQNSRKQQKDMLTNISGRRVA